MSDSTANGKPAKPEKPYPEFPLFPHATGRWAKKIRGKFHYFGPWDDPDGALRKYLDQKDPLHAGRTPRAPGDGLTVRDLANRFLTAKKRQATAGELAMRTFRDYYSTCARVVECFGRTRLVESLTADDFGALRDAMAKTLGPASRKTEIQKTKAIFNYAYNMDLIDRPIKFGPDFKAPPARVLKKARQQNGTKMFSAAEIRAMLDAALPHIKAMILLGINAGFGNRDVATLPVSALDLDAGWLEHPRPKTGVDRRCPLWPETVDALRAVIANRREPKDPADADLVFLTQNGKPWIRLTHTDPDKINTAGWVDSVTVMVKVLLDKLGLRKPGRNFYALRHTFATIGGESLDQVAVNHIMGHVDSTMAGVYREKISDERLRAVANHVRTWLFGLEKTE